MTDLFLFSTRIKQIHWDVFRIVQKLNAQSNIWLNYNTDWWFGTDEQVDKNMLRWAAREGIVCITGNAKFVKTHILKSSLRIADRHVKTYFNFVWEHFEQVLGTHSTGHITKICPKCVTNLEGMPKHSLCLIQKQFSNVFWIVAHYTRCRACCKHMVCMLSQRLTSLLWNNVLLGFVHAKRCVKIYANANKDCQDTKTWCALIRRMKHMC